MVRKVKCYSCGQILSNKFILRLHMETFHAPTNSPEHYPGKIWFYIEPRLSRDMTHSTDWNLICTSTSQ